MRTSNLQTKKIEQQFIESLRFHGIEQIVSSLQLVHDMALYHSDCSIDDREKIALYDLKLLWEGVLGLEG